MKKNKALKIALLTSLGSGFEYYDFVIYATMAKYLSPIFFPSETEILGQLKIFLIFATGYFVRPFAGLFFGIIADTYGRKKTFIATMLLMSASTFAIGILPGFSQIGIASPILLVFFRMMQGISFGAELPGATVIVKEFSPNKFIGRFCSLVLSSTSLGFLLASLFLVVLTNIFTDEEITNGAWRIPFIFGGILAIISYFIRKSISETPDFLSQWDNLEKASAMATFKEVFLRQKSNLLIGIGITLFQASLVITYLYLVSYHIGKFFDYAQKEIYFAVTISMIFSFFSILLFGVISDKFEKITIAFTAMTGFVVTIFPMMKMLENGSQISLVIFLINIQLWISVFFTSHMPLLSSIFPTKIRYTGIALSYNIAFLLASFIPSITTYMLSAQTQPSSKYGVITFFIIAAAISAISLFLIHKPDRKVNY